MTPLFIAHRGKHDKFYENTLGAFLEASKVEFFGLETDIHLSKDKKWVIHHDDDFLSNGKKYLIKDLTYEELKALPLDNDQGDKEARIPLLEEYLQICLENKKRPIIEIKNSPKYKDLKKLMKYLENEVGLDNLSIIAFYPWPLLKIKCLMHKKVHMQLLISEQHFSFVMGVAKRHHLDIDIDINLLTKEIVDSVHKRGKKINVWCADTKEEITKVTELGVDYITTNNFPQK